MGGGREPSKEGVGEGKAPPPKRPISKLLEKMRSNPKGDWTLEKVIGH